MSEDTPLIKATKVEENNDEFVKKPPIAVDRYYEVMMEEFNAMYFLAPPMVATYILTMIPSSTITIFVGYIDSDDAVTYLAAAGIANMFFGMLASSPAMGLSLAMDTLCSQANGAGEYLKMGIFFQTGVIVLTVLFLLVCIFGINASYVLQKLGNSEEISDLAQTFFLYMVPGLPFMYLFNLCKKVLDAQGIVRPSLYATIYADVVFGILGYYFVYHTSLGWKGAAVARSIALFVRACYILSALLEKKMVEKFWPGIQIREAFRAMDEWLPLGISGMVRLCIARWVMEFIVVFCAYLEDPDTAIAVNTIIYSMTSISFVVYVGISVSGNIRIALLSLSLNPKGMYWDGRIHFGQKLLHIVRLL